MPDILFDSEELIPEGLKGHEKKTELGKFVVKVVPEAKLVEFRENNVTLSKERDVLKGQWEKVAPLVGESLDDFMKTYDELKQTAQKVADGKLKTSEDIEVELTKRTGQMRESYDRQIAGEAEKRANAEARAVDADKKYRQSLVDRCVTDAVLNEKSGVEPAALPDILNRAYGVFHVEDNGVIIAKDGDATIYGADGSTPMTAIEWLATLKERAPYFFKGSSGGNATGNKGNDKVGGMTRADFNKLPAATRLKMANEGQVHNVK